MNTNYAEIDLRDIVKSALTAAIAAVAVALYNVFQQTGFDIFTADWVAIGQLMLNTAIGALVADIGRRFFTDENGKLFGAI